MRANPAILDFGMGNIGSVVNMLSKLGAQSFVGSRREEILQASHLVLPGVGKFDEGMRNIAPCIRLIEEFVATGKPVIGICLGMQLLFDGSEEGVLPGLAWVPGHVRKFRYEQGATVLPVPHMGWQAVTVKRSSSLFRPDDTGQPRFYFVHSYHVIPVDPNDVTSYGEYGFPFVASVERGNIMGVQFHPEKSHAHGLRLLERFLALSPVVPIAKRT